MADARSKADILARTGRRLDQGRRGHLRDDLVAHRPYYYSAAAVDAAKEASTPIQTGTTDIRIQVTVAYLIG